jgi:ribonuclease P protein component
MSSSAQGLSRAERVRKRPDFVRIQQSSVRVTTRHLLILFARQEVAPPGEAGRVAAARIGIVASRKVGPAVARNRAKRLVRELFRRNKELFPRGVDLVVIVRPGTQDRSLAELEAELRPLQPILARRAAEALRAPAAPRPPRPPAPASEEPKRPDDR